MNQKKQVIILGVLAVLALGAGSYYIFGRGDDDMAARAWNTAPAQKQTLTSGKDTGKSQQKQTLTQQTTEKPVASTKTKLESTSTSRGPKTKLNSGDKGKVKKRQMSPAA